MSGGNRGVAVHTAMSIGAVFTRIVVCARLGILFCLWSAIGYADALLPSAVRPQPLAAALAEFAHQTGLQLVYVSDVVKNQNSKGVRAGISTSEALTALLDGTGLTFEFINQRAVRIFPTQPMEKGSRN